MSLSINALVLSWYLALVPEAEEDPFEPLKETERKMNQPLTSFMLDLALAINKKGQLHTLVHLSYILCMRSSDVYFTLHRKKGCMLAHLYRKSSSLLLMQSILCCLKRQQVKPHLHIPCLIVYVLGVIIMVCSSKRQSPPA